MKLCKDCRWIRPAEDDRGALCGHPTSVNPTRTSLVTGERIPAYQFNCASLREFLAFSGFCGSEGVHWEAADATPAGFV
jgi:hypothetical protein